MADPIRVICPEKVWTKINASAPITTGFIGRPLDMGAFLYRAACRDAGNTPPDNNDDTDGGNAERIFQQSNKEELTFPTPGDVYIRVKDSNDEIDSSAAITVYLP